MKTLYSFLTVLALTVAGAFNSQACDLSSFTLNSHTDLGGGLHEYTVTFCAGRGTTGAGGQTGTWGVQLDGGATFSSYPFSLTSPQTAAVYESYLYNTNLLVFDVVSWPNGSTFPFPGAWTCVCGPAGSACVTFTYVTDGAPTSMTLMGAEAASVFVPPYGCNGQQDLVINLGGPVVDAGATAYYCLGGSATLTATVSGGTAPYTYLWEAQYVPAVVGTSASVTVAPTANELYLLTVTDANGLSSSDYKSVVVYQPPVANAGADKTKYIGYGAQSVTLSGSGNGSMPPYSYQWSNGATTASITVSPVVTTNYTLTVTDARGCVQQDVAQVRVLDIRCGSNKVRMCRNNVNACVNTSQVPTRLNQGWVLGACGSNKTDETESFTELSEETMSTIFPNPASAQATVNYTFIDDVNVTVGVYDVSGRLIQNIVSNKSIFAGEQNTETISVAELPSGFYFVGINASNGESIMHKLMVAR